MYVEKVNTKSPSLNYQLNDRLTRKGIRTTSNEFLMPNKAFCAFWIYCVKSMPFCVETGWYWLGIFFLLHLPLCLCIGFRLCADIRAINGEDLCFALSTTTE